MAETGGGEHPVSAARIGELRKEITQRLPQAEKISKKSGLQGIALKRNAINVAGDSYLRDLDLKKQEELTKKAEEGSQFDKLTTLRNEKGFEDRIEETIAQYRRDKRELQDKTKDPNTEPYELVIVYLDIRGLKEKNDQSEDSHSGGDRFLQETGQILRVVTRETDTVARLHGDEFAILMRTSLKEAKEVWVPKLTEYANEQEKKFAIGLAKLDPEDWEKTIKEADTAQKMAKAMSNEISASGNTPVETLALTYEEAMKKSSEDPDYARKFNSGRTINGVYTVSG